MILGQAGDGVWMVGEDRLTKHKKSLKRIKKRKICIKKKKNLHVVVGSLLIFSHFCGDSRGESA